ncbi:MAG: serine/threonine-protein kinase [Candidatus Micrarchaeota archaeon]
MCRISRISLERIKREVDARLRLGDELIGKRYLLLDHIGQGATANVHTAYDVKKDEVIALKMVDETRDKLLVSRQFYREIAALEHLPKYHGIVNLETREISEGLPVLVLEYIEPQKMTKIPIRNMTHFLKQILESLEHSHQNGVIHRDIKPANIILTQRDDQIDAVLIDFGFAWFIGDEYRIGQVAGTPNYRAPESIGPKFQMSESVDIYALGWTVREWVYRKKYFDEYEFEADKKLTQIVDKAIKYKYEERYKTAREMLSDLEDYTRETSIKKE